jgi:hypothetical protein
MLIIISGYLIICQILKDKPPLTHKLTHKRKNTELLIFIFTKGISLKNYNINGLI